ncbi:MAG: hypothetical protein ACRDY7_09490, partial [Acidimicrobiia bacterium]
MLVAADGARLSIIAVNAPATNVPIDGGGPAAQASLDSLGTSQSFAAQPYPGDLAISGPGLVAGLSNGQVTPPNYPFYVSADHPIIPEQSLEQPGYQLKANATEREAAASARSGGTSADNAVASTAAAARAGSDDTTVVGEASSLTVGFSAGPLTIGRVSAQASVIRRADGTLVRQSSLDVAGAKVGDTPISITAEGITVAGTEVPLGDGTAAAEALSDSGVTVEYLAGQETETGVVAPTLEVSWAGAAPGPISPVGFVATFGRALAGIDGGGGSGGAAPGVPAAAPDEPPAPSQSGSPPLHGGGEGGVAPAPGVAAPSAAPAPAPAGSSPPGAIRRNAPLSLPAAATFGVGRGGGVSLTLGEPPGAGASAPAAVTPTSAAEAPASPTALVAAPAAATALA